jgi:hypothetical protein
MAAADPIRQEIDTIVEEVMKIVKAWNGKPDLTFIFQMAGSLPLILSTGVYFQAAPAKDKATYIGEAFDALTGTDEHSLLKNIPYLTPQTTEDLADSLKLAIIEAIENRYGPPPVTPA